RRVERGQRRVGFRDEQRDLGAAKNHRIAPPLTKLVDDLSKILPGAFLEAAVDQLAEDDLVDALAFTGRGNLATDAVDREPGSVDRYLHKVASSQDPEALEASHRGESRDLFGNMEPWNG